MNERLTKLAQQANIEFTYDPTETPVRAFVECWEDELEKFAELIVHQMLEITDAHTEVFQTDRDQALIEHIKQSVKQHFGVE